MDIEDDAPVASGVETTPLPADSDEAGGPPRQKRGISSGVLLVVLAIGSVGVGFLLGRVMRDTQETPVAAAPSDTFIPAEGLPPVTTVGEESHPLKGTTAPDFRLTDLATGQDVRLADYKGRPVLVNFWATWCPPCRMEMPWLEEAHQRHGAEGLAILAVNAGERVAPEMVTSTIKSYVEGAGLTFPILVGDAAGPLQSAWGVFGLPASYIIDRDGTIVDVHVGMYPSQDELEQRLAAVMGEGAS